MVDKYSFSSASLAHSYRWHLPEIIKIIRKHKPKRLLDLGCGNGSLVKHLISNFNIDCIGIDPSEDGITFAKDGGFDKNFYLLDDDKVKKFKKGDFDMIISIDVIEHVHNTSEYLEFIKSLLTPNSIFYFTTTYHSKFKWLLLALAGRTSEHVDPLWPMGRCKFFNKKQLQKLLSENGLDYDIFTSGKNFLPSSFNVISSLQRS
tara:strand:- start:54 stop:665 length:612 start_codon:yes stop_codon:yes gene_type:complete